MTASQQSRVEELFEALADAPLEHRRALLEAQCLNDAVLVEAVWDLLQADTQGGHEALRLNTATMASHLLESSERSQIPARLGRYVLEEFLGQGGMGRVYRAHREDLNDCVAIKFLQDAWLSPARRQRFAREQRLLASLNHPNIARLYDAGVENETPWFAMEYVEGLPIHMYCQSRTADLDERLSLFRQVCEAIRYAHRNLAVHLDLKPSNILVNREGAVKLLDFGIARNLAEDGSQTERTKTNLRLFSLDYAAPEQIQGEPLDVQTDVHGLGVILYELLTGRTPADLSGAPVAALIRFAEQEVRRPSEATQENGKTLIRASKSDWRELDVLCLTALHRDRKRRYETAEALIRDLDHFERNEPLEAQPDSVLYRARKFWARHRWPLLFAALVFVVFAATTGAFTAGLIEAKNRAQSSQKRTQRIHQIMLDLFDGDDSAAGPSKGVLAVDLLDRGVKRAQTSNEEPELRAQLEYTFGTLYERLGRFDQAEPLLRSSLAWQIAHLKPSNPDILHSKLALAGLLTDQSKYVESAKLAREAVSEARLYFARDSNEVGQAAGTFGSILQEAGDYKNAVPLLTEAVGTLEKLVDAESLSQALSSLANSYYCLGQVEVSESLNLRVLALDRRAFGPIHPHVAVDLLNLAEIQMDRGEYKKAEKYLRTSVVIEKDWYGQTHPQTATSLLMLGQALKYQGQLDAAGELYRQGVEIARAVRGEKSLRYASALSLVGDLLRDRNDLRGAEQAFQKAASIFKESAGEQHEFYAHQLSNMGSICLKRKQYSEAKKLLRKALGVLTANVSDPRYLGIAQTRLAAALAGKKEYAEAARQALAACESLRRHGDYPTVELQAAKRELEAIRGAMNQ